MREPTYISTDIVDQRDAEFPAITVCPEFPYKEDVLVANGIEDRQHYYHSTKLETWSSNNTNITEPELFEEATYSFDEIISTFYVRMNRANPVRYFSICNGIQIKLCTGKYF